VLAAGGTHLHTWNIESRQRVPSFSLNTLVLIAAFSPDRERLATSGIDGTIVLWDVTSGQQLLTLAGFDGVPPSTLVFSPDGTGLAGASPEGPEGGKMTVKVWDARPLGK
jgi:WD40 repeat protein